MKTSPSGIKFLEREELSRPVVGKHITKDGRWIVYPDPRGLPTIGYGHLVKPNEDFSAGLTQDEVDTLFDTDLDRFERCIAGHVTWPSMTQNQFDAMLSLAYNIGEAGFSHSSVLRYLNAGNVAQAADAFLLWKNAGGKPILLARRQRERTLFLAPDTQPREENAPRIDTEASMPEENEVKSRISDETRSNAYAAVSSIAGFLNPAIGIAMQVAPSLIRLFGSKDSAIAERNAAAAEKVGEIMKSVTDKPTYEQAAQALQDSPDLQTQFRAHVRANADDIEALMVAEDVSRGAATDRVVKLASSPAAVDIFNTVTKMQFSLTAAVLLGVVVMIGVLTFKSANGDIPGWAVGMANALLVAVALEWRNIIHSVVGKDAETPK